jgi:hypothetical protein
VWRNFLAAKFPNGLPEQLMLGAEVEIHDLYLYGARVDGENMMA